MHYERRGLSMAHSNCAALLLTNARFLRFGPNPYLGTRCTRAPSVVVSRLVSQTAAVLHRSSGSGRVRVHAGYGSLRSGRRRRLAAAGRPSRPASPGAFGRRTRRARRESLYHRPDLEAPKAVGRAMRHYAVHKSVHRPSPGDISVLSRTGHFCFALTSERNIS